MVRLACISIPRADLQVLALRHPDWRQLPAAVVTEEKPLGRITAVNRAAKRAGVQPGMRYASALSICPHLRAGEVRREELDNLNDRIVGVLHGFTPEVEPSAADTALFWVNAAGLGRLYASPAEWAGSLQIAVERQDVVCSVAVGFSRFGTYAAAKSKRALTVFTSEDQERAAALRSPVGVLPLDHDVLERFHQLGIMTIRDFNRFSSGALRRRFGSDVERLQLFAREEEALPLQPVVKEPPLARQMRLLYPEGSSNALCDHLNRLIEELVAQAWSRQELIAEITFTLCPEYWPGSMDDCAEQSLKAARPTGDQRTWARLLRLRFETLTLPGPVVTLAVQARTTPVTREQGDLFTGSPRRDARRARAAIADICAELGNDAVQVARVHDNHLPHERFSWHRVDELLPPRPRDAGGQTLPVRTPLIRRILSEPERLGSEVSRLVERKSGGAGRVGSNGPYVVSGGWWKVAPERNSREQPSEVCGKSHKLHAPYSQEVQPEHAAFSQGGRSESSGSYEREYFYVEEPSGRLLWIYHDVLHGRWMIEGLVE